MTAGYILQTPYLETPVDEIIINELPSISALPEEEQVRTIKEWGLQLGCSKKRCEQLAYLYGGKA